MLTDSVETQGVVGQAKVALLCDLGLQLLDGCVMKLLDPPALNADQMIMVIPPVQFEHGVRSFKVMSDHQPCSFELGENPIDGGKADFFALTDQRLENFLGTEVLGGGRTFKDLEDLDAWQGDLEARIPDVLAFQITLPTHCLTGADRL